MRKVPSKADFNAGTSKVGPFEGTFLIIFESKIQKGRSHARVYSESRAKMRGAHRQFVPLKFYGGGAGGFSAVRPSPPESGGM